jgi:hypothetical protein
MQGPSGFERKTAAPSHSSAGVRALALELEELALRVRAGGENGVARPLQQSRDFQGDRPPLFGGGRGPPGRFHFLPVHIEQAIEQAIVARGNRVAEALSRW